MPRFAEGTGVPAKASGAPSSSALQIPDRIQVKNRRKKYLDEHSEYFGPQLELAGVAITVLNR